MKRFISLALLFSFIISTSAFAQKEIEIKKGSFRIQLSDGFVSGAESKGEIVGIELKKYDPELNEIKTSTIEIPELAGITSIKATFGDFNSGIIELTILSKLMTIGDAVNLYIDTDLKELSRVFLTKEEVKSASQQSALQKNILPAGRHELINESMDYNHFNNDLYTSDGQLYLYYDNSIHPLSWGIAGVMGTASVNGFYADKNAKTTLLRYSSKDKKYTQAWECNLDEIQNIASYKMIVRGNNVFLHIVSIPSKEDLSGQLNIICIDYETGTIKWNSKIAMTAGLRPEPPVLSYDEKSGTLAFAGMESVPENWRKQIKDGNIVCRIYLGSIDPEGHANVSHTPMPVFNESDFVGSNMKNELDRPYWVPGVIVKRSDGTYLACGVFGFTDDFGAATVGEGKFDYLFGTRWVGGSMYATFGDGGTSAKIKCNYFSTYNMDTFGKNVTENAPFFWDTKSETLYMGLVNSNEDFTLSKMMVGYYVVAITGSSSKISLVAAAEAKVKVEPAQLHGAVFPTPLHVPYVLALNAKHFLYIPFDIPIEKIVSETI